ncbi:MAG: orotate phosphoribosyltransferase [Clostridia bacterium]|nr:orotate phosphoribosyltransferase [Clostridia bacterium]
MTSNNRVLDIFTESGALLHGHFILTSGKHSDRYMQCAQVLKHPHYTEELARGIASAFRDDAIDLVIGPAMGGMIIAYEVARQLGVTALFSERVEGAMALRRGFAVEEGQRVLVVEDVVTTGGSVAELIELVRRSGGIIAGVATLVDRSNGSVDFGVKQHSLLALDIQSWDPSMCPLCVEGSAPAVKPGSRERRS